MKTLSKIIFCILIFTTASCVIKPDQDDIVPPDGSSNAFKVYPDQPPVFGFGREVSEEEILLWDSEVRPDGTGLPAGEGTAGQGERIYQQKCMVCHGPTGREGPFDQLAGTDSGENFDFGKDRKLVKTVGNYWPYATTLYDYIQRAMPQTAPGTLTSDEVYNLAAYILFLNEIIPEDFVLDEQSLPGIKMPAHDRFVIDNRKGGDEIL